MPRVSIIIPVHNREDLVVETLESVRAQTFGDWECVVVDDHSTDSSLAVAERYATEDRRFRAFSLPPEKHNANAARNLGFAKSTGEYIIFLDSDDLLAPWCLDSRLEVLHDNAGLDFCVFCGEAFQRTPGDMRVSGWGSQIEEPDLDQFLKARNPWLILHPMWTRAAACRVGPWDESLPSWQDWDFHVRALIKGLRYEKVAVPDTYFRVKEPGRESIGVDFDANPISHLPACERLMRKIHDLLIEADLLNEDRRRFLVRRYNCLIIRPWRRCRRWDEALRVWTMCYGTGLISKRVLTQARLLLALEQVRGLNRLSAWMMRRWAGRNGFVKPKGKWYFPAPLREDIEVPRQDLG